VKKRILLFIIFFCTFCFSGENLMNKIQFEPNEFNALPYNWNNYIWDENENACCNKISEVNKISINLPSKIYVNNNIVQQMPVPICISYYITEKRIYKYSEKEYELTLYIKQQLDVKKTEWFKYPVEKKEFIDYSMQEITALSPDFESEENERNMLIKQYKSLSDRELNDGYVYGGNITFNISDYINFPLEQGKYEIFITRNNIESEHKIIQVIYM